MFHENTTKKMLGNKSSVFLNLHQRHLKHIYLHKKNGMFPWIMIQFQVNN